MSGYKPIDWGSVERLEEYEKVLAERDRLKNQLAGAMAMDDTNLRVIDRLKAELETHNSCCAAYSERDLWKSKAEKLAGALRDIIDAVKHGGVEGSPDPCTSYCCAQHMVNMHRVPEL